MMKWLEEPYPCIESTSLKLAISCGIGLVCAIFLIVFQPFGLSAVADKPSFFFGFGLMATIALLTAYFLLPRIWPRFFDTEQWKIKHELIFFSSVILQISVMNYFYNSTIGRAFSPQYGYLSFLLMTLAVGVLPILIMTYITEMVARGRNVVTAELLNKVERPKEQSSSSSEMLNIISEDKSPVHLDIVASSFLYAQSQNNYVQIFWTADDKVLNQLMRMKLKNLTEQLPSREQFLRVHKSYMIYKPNVVKISGNARSLQLTMKGCDQLIPVSRSFDKEQLSN